MNTIKKLRGYDFYHAIGSPQRIVAPMVDQSELAFRMLCRKYGADLCYTPMFHSRLFVESVDYRKKMMEIHTKDRPLIVQFCGNDPKILLQAAKHVETLCDAVDLNLGCPQGIARKGKYGSFLMHDKDRVQEIVSTLSTELAIPVCVKIRIFPDEQETIEFCKMLQEAGCDMLVVHGRTKEMNKHTVGPVNWDIIRKIKETLTIPVIANGGIETYQDIKKCMELTKVDGVMSSEAILENPALFTPITDVSVLSQVKLAQEYIAETLLYPPYTDKIIRAHLFKFLFQELAAHTDLRSLLGKVRSREKMAEIVNELQSRLEMDENEDGEREKKRLKREENEENEEKKEEIEVTSIVFQPSRENTWYRRHRRIKNKVEEQEN